MFRRSFRSTNFFLSMFNVIKLETKWLFVTAFELWIQHRPMNFGFLFYTDNSGHTPFAMACEKFGNEEVTKVVEDTLSAKRNYTEDKKILECLISLAVDETVHLDGVFFILRRDPSIMARALSGGKNAASR
jgi:hypothetical protein